MDKKYYLNLIKIALKEDLGNTGDITTDAIFKNNDKIETFKLIAKENGILCGKDVFIDVFKTIDKKCEVEFYFNDKDSIKKGDIIARVRGRVSSILKGERTALNFISHLSGIATKTSLFVHKANGKVKILDTRKTIPGLRYLQKYAVLCGGGTNHRIGLFDMVLIKDNHIDAAGSITEAVNLVRKKWGSRYKIEVETRNLEEVKEALRLNVDRIMLDNMDIETIKEAIKIINKKSETEVSGNMTIDKIEEMAEAGVDFISFGELTHTIKVFDFSLKKE
ncbi:MAG TPA: carboxylating nicotinate-nucleotide diphosphorylase [Spirochaetota bacterium]|nr:carboxylating nicotinate-nucleotide diphosphorylase [Spirochaetota bacterium]HOL56727.1 carboxylating nicotinate-nucleotide diphosphorylase [Spirochaetota bacterium]HPP04118.1 carboxylating nicotinate-nucleotide diphosphorylase [Spirochaetota bacterium]